MYVGPMAAVVHADNVRRQVHNALTVHARFHVRQVVQARNAAIMAAAVYAAYARETAFV